LEEIKHDAMTIPVHAGGRPNGRSARRLSIQSAGIEVLDDLGSDHRRQHEHTDRRVGAVDDRVRTVLAAREADDIARPV
jgi:hypothetical protein